MDPILETVRSYIDQHRKGNLPSQNRPSTTTSSVFDRRPNFYHGMQYFTILEDRIFGVNQQIHLGVDQITAKDQQNNTYLRQKLMHNHEFFEIFYVYSGRCISTINDQPQEFTAGDVCFYTPKAIHCMQTPGDGDVVINLLIRKSLFDETFLTFVNNNDLVTGFFIDSLYNARSEQRHVVFHKDQAEIARPVLLQMLYESIRHDSFSQDILRAYLVCLLTDLARSYTRSLENEPSLNGRQLDIREVISFISRHYQTLTIQQLADAFGYSVRSMSGFIKRTTGKNFRETLQSFRLRSACRLLSSSDLALDDIPDRVGYTQRSSFERAFKENFHMTPLEYRKKYGPSDRTRTL